MRHPYAATNNRSVGVKKTEVRKSGKGGDGLRSGEACKLQTCPGIEEKRKKKKNTEKKRLLRNSTCFKLLLEEPVRILKPVMPTVIANCFTCLYSDQREI